MSEPAIKKSKQTFSYLPARLVAATAMVLLTSVLIVPGMSTYLPVHQNDAIGLPILLFPFVWSGLFIYCFVEHSVKRMWLVLVALAVIHIAFIYFALAN